MARLNTDIRSDRVAENQVAEGADMMVRPSRSRVSLSRSQFAGLIVLLIALVGAIGWLGYKVSAGKQDPQKVVAAQNEALVEEVGKLILLPQGETPTVATVNDLAPLKGQAFFDHAKIGDKVLIYTTARKAFLFDPAQNKIIEVAPISIGSQSSPQSQSTTGASPATTDTTTTDTSAKKK